MGPILQRAIIEARHPQLIDIKEALGRFKSVIAEAQSSCPHPLILQGPDFPHLPHRICARCGLEEVARYVSGGWTHLDNAPGRDVEKVERGDQVYSLRPPLGASLA